MKIVFVILVLCSSVVFGEDLSQEYLQANHELSSNLLEEVSKNHQGNVVFSSFSLESILALTALGSKGTTANEIKKLLKLPENEEKIKTDFTALHTMINQVKHIEVTTANKVYLADKTEIEPNFTKTAEEVFGTEIENINFGVAQNAADEINSWVSQQTHDKIKNLIKPDQLSDITKLVLINALYFKGEWNAPFYPHRTKKQDFHISQNETIQVDTMSVTTSFPIHRNDEHNVTFIRLPYFGRQAVLTIVLPDKIEGLDGLQPLLKHSVPKHNYTNVYSRIKLPKFHIETSIDMKPILENLGVKEIFGRPDLSGITTESLKVDHVNQKVFIDVNEKGTEAAVATSMIASARTLRIPKEFNVNRPFLFILQLDEVALFTGRVMNPSQQ